MIRTIGLALSMVFIFMLLGCGGQGDEKPSGININPEKKVEAKVKKPEPPAEVVWLNETFGKYFEGEGLKEFAANLKTMTAEEFESTLRGLGTEEDKPSEEDIAKAIEFFAGWKAKEAEKAEEKAEETAESTE